MKHRSIMLPFFSIMIATSFLAPVIAAEDVKMPSPVSQSDKSTVSEYRLSKYDVLNIVIVGFSDILFSGSSSQQSSLGLANANTSTDTSSTGLNDIVIGPDGYVNLPYAGSVKLAGLTIPEARDLLTEKLGEYIKIPSMALIVKQYGPRKVYVMGEVTKQGIYALSSEYMNVFAAISSAGGITKRGRPKHIAVVRMVDGKVQMQEINFDRFIEKQDASQNVALQDGDMVYVPRSNKIDLNEDIMPVVNSIAVLHTLTN